MSNLLVLGNFTLSPAAHIKIEVDDSADGDGGHVSFPAAISNNQVVQTSLTINSLDAGRVRWNIGGQHGTWRSTPGLFTETISASADGFAALEYDPFSVLVMDYPSLSVG